MNNTRFARKRISVAMVTFAATASTLAATTLVAPDAHAAPRTASLAGKTVFLDPGHQGSAAGNRLNAQVPDGRGGKKDCQTTGATGVNGVPEHTVNWQIAQLGKAGLESQGAKVVLSRPDDTGWGGCVDKRAAAASRSGAAVAVSLHADSTSTGADATNKGFHIIVPTLPIPDATVNRVQSGAGRTASTAMRDALVGAGLSPANYGGVTDGLQTRSDIAAVNLTKVPVVFIEMGNLSNPAEAAALTSKEGQLKYALAITDGITRYVTKSGNKVVSTAASKTPAMDTTAMDTPALKTPDTTPVSTGNPPDPTTPAADDDNPFTGLRSVLPFVEKVMAADDTSEIIKLLTTDGSDVFSDVLKAMLEVVYGLAGGKLPI